jgi:hypothetical protein
LPSFSKQGVDGRDIRAFTQEPVEDGRGRPDVFDGLLPGHGSKEVTQHDLNPL